MSPTDHRAHGSAIAHEIPVEPVQVCGVQVLQRDAADPRDDVRLQVLTAIIPRVVLDVGRRGRREPLPHQVVATVRAEDST